MRSGRAVAGTPNLQGAVDPKPTVRPYTQNDCRGYGLPTFAGPVAKDKGAPDSDRSPDDDQPSRVDPEPTFCPSQRIVESTEERSFAQRESTAHAK